MASNLLAPEGGAALAEGLKGNATLTSLECTCQMRKVLSDQRRQPLTVVGQRTSSAFVGSLRDNNLTNYGKDMSGVHKLAEALPQTKIEKLKCVPLSPLFQIRKSRLVGPASAAADTGRLKPLFGSLARNALCGVKDDRFSDSDSDDEDGNGKYTTEGITALCDGLKGSAVTSLECAAMPNQEGGWSR